MKVLIFIFLLTLAVNVYGVEYLDRSACWAPERHVFFANGMFNSFADAASSRERLRSQFGNTFKSYSVAYNTNEPILTQLFQVLRQKGKSLAHKFWAIIDNPAVRGLPKDFLRLFAKYHDERLLFSEYAEDVDLKKQVAQYLEVLHKGEDILVVSHSQGNFYAYSGTSLVSMSLEHDSNAIAMVSVATPQSGNLYTNLESDWVIRLIPDAAPANARNSNAGKFDHEFIRHYMNGDGSGPKIINDVTSTLEINHDARGSIYTRGYVDISLRPMWKWILKQHYAPKRNYSKTECLAASLFLKTYNWTGVECKRRSLKNLTTGAKACVAEWQDDHKTGYGCQLIGLPAGFGSTWSLSEEEIKFLRSHPECRYSKETAKKELTETMVSAALKFMEAPSVD